MLHIHPLRDWILVTPVRRVKRASGIVVPETARFEGEGEHEFHVIATGPEVKHIHAHDRVICPFEHEGAQYLLGDPQRRAFIRQSQVLAVIPFDVFERHSELESNPATNGG